MRVSIRLRFTQLSSAVKKGVPATTHQDRVGDQDVFINQAGPHGCAGQRRTTDAHRPAALRFESCDLGDGITGDQPGISLDSFKS